MLYELVERVVDDVWLVPILVLLLVIAVSTL